jgi:hypothetical protein
MPNLMNDNGAVAGADFVDYRNSQGYVRLSAFASPSGHVHAASLNNQGVVVGYYSGAGLQGPYEPFFYVPGVDYLFDLRQVFGWTEGFATSINNSQSVVGWGRVNSSPAMLPPEFSELKTSGQPVALQLNDSGQILLNLRDGTSGPNPSFLYTPGRGVEQLPGSAVVMNNRGQVVLVLANNRYAIYMPGEAMTLLPDTLPDQYGRQVGLAYYALNDRGELVGNRYATDDNRATLTQGFYYDSASGSGTLVPLTALVPANSGWYPTRAQTINNRGQILSDAGSFSQGGSIILTPEQSSLFEPR